jgi:hypothetical protein
MNWELFYQLNERWINNLMLGFIYFCLFALLALSIKNLMNSLAEDDLKD